MMNLYIDGMLFKNGTVFISGSGQSDLEGEINKIGEEEKKMLADGDFIRLSLIPANGAWWMDPKKHFSKWHVNKGSSTFPHWYQSKLHDKMFRKEACGWWRKHVFFHRELCVLADGLYFLKNCHVKDVCRNAHIICEDSIIDRMRNHATAEYVCGSSCIRKMYDSSKIKKLCGYSVICEMNQTSHVESMSDSALVKSMRDSTGIGCMNMDTRVLFMSDHASVSSLRGHASVQRMNDDSFIEQVDSNALIWEINDNSSIRSVSNSSKKNRNQLRYPEHYYGGFPFN